MITMVARSGLMLHYMYIATLLSHCVVFVKVTVIQLPINPHYTHHINLNEEKIVSMTDKYRQVSFYVISLKSTSKFAPLFKYKW